MSSSSMFSSVVPQYCTNLSVLGELLLSEKENTRLWLRAEMDRFVDPMIDSIFDKITNKLVGSGNLGGCCGLNCTQMNPLHLIQTFNHAESSISQIHQPSSHISTCYNQEFLQQNPIGDELEPEFKPKILTEVKQEIEDENEMAMKNVMDNTLSQQIKEEFDEQEVGEGMIHKGHHIAQRTQPRKVKTPSPSTDHHHLIQNHNMSKPPLNVSTEEGPKVKEEFDDEANNDGQIVEIKKEEKGGNGETRLNDIEIKEEYDDGQMIKIKEEGGSDPETSRSVNVRIEASQPHPFGKSDMLKQKSEKSTKRKKTHDKHVPSKVNNRNDHKKEDYDEKEATPRSVKRPRLSCPTTSSSTTQETHYAKQHKPTFNCQHSGCVYQTSTLSMLKRHQLTHLDMKPYRCKWQGCDYTAVQKGQTIVHICVKHLVPNPGSVHNGTQFDPKDNLEVVHDLL